MIGECALIYGVYRGLEGGIARYQYERCVRVDLTDGSQQIQAVHIGELQVRYYHVDGPLVRPGHQSLHGLGAASARSDPVPLVLQETDQGLPQTRFIVGDKNVRRIGQG